MVKICVSYMLFPIKQRYICQAFPFFWDLGSREILKPCHRLLFCETFFNNKVDSRDDSVAVSIFDIAGKKLRTVGTKTIRSVLQLVYGIIWKFHKIQASVDLLP